MGEELSIRNRGEAIDYLMAERGLEDASILEVSFAGLKAWLTRSANLPQSIDGGDQYWLLPNGEIVNTHILGASLAEEYEAQFGKPFPFGKTEIA